MNRKYPYTLFVFVQADSDQDEDGEFDEKAGGWVELCPCRDEAENGKTITTVDNRVFAYSFLIQCPKGTEAIKLGTKIKVMDGDAERCSGTVVYSHQNRLHTRQWV